MEFKLRQFVPSQICLSCDGCCRFAEEDTIWSPVLIDSEIVKFAKDSRYSKFLSKEEKLKLQSYKDTFICPFFEPIRNGCNIYLYRPFDCKLYPFLLTKKDNSVFLGVDLKCPYIRDKRASEEFQKYIDYLLDFFQRKDFRLMLENNPQIIGDYKQDVEFLRAIELK